MSISIKKIIPAITAVEHYFREETLSQIQNAAVSGKDFVLHAEPLPPNYPEIDNTVNIVLSKEEWEALVPVKSTLTTWLEKIQENPRFQGSFRRMLIVYNDEETTAQLRKLAGGVDIDSSAGLPVVPLAKNSKTPLPN